MMEKSYLMDSRLLVLVADIHHGVLEVLFFIHFLNSGSNKVPLRFLVYNKQQLEVPNKAKLLRVLLIKGIKAVSLSRSVFKYVIH